MARFSVFWEREVWDFSRLSWLVVRECSRFQSEAKMRRFLAFLKKQDGVNFQVWGAKGVEKNVLEGIGR